MEAPLQQRIVGAIVLVTLGVIFIPALLDGSGYRSRQAQDIVVKDKPEFPPLSQKKLKPVATPLDARDDKSAIETAKKSDQKQASGKQAANKKIRSFALQVGTFDNNKNAEKLRNKLRKAGYTAFVQKSTSSKKTTYKVKVGPELERSLLDKWKKELKKSHKIDAYVVNYP